MGLKKNTISEEKHKGRIYTPDYIVEIILDMSGYIGTKILKKHVIDNSCGDGAFLVKIAERYCTVAKEKGLHDDEIAKDLSLYLHGIEIEQGECTKCINKLDNIVQKFGIHNVVWDIRCADTLEVSDFNNKMDYVLGNPPYVRVHNLGENFNKTKQFSFAKDGMTDLFIVFYEIGIKMLNEKGTLGYITPSSFFNSLAGHTLRNYLMQNNLISTIIDLKHFQAFKATTYTAITILEKAKHGKKIAYYEFDPHALKPKLIDSSLSAVDVSINGNLYFSKKKMLEKLKNILENKYAAICTVKNGFATLNDKFFIGEFNFKEHVIPIIKASTGKEYQCVFPYDTEGKIIPYETLVKNEQLKKYFETNMDNLQDRDIEKNAQWYAFGRSQGLNDVYKTKYAINALLRTEDDIKFIKCPPGVGVYSGLYILTSLPEEKLKTMLFSSDFVNYIKMLCKYKSGGYYTYSSKDLQTYLNFKCAEAKGADENE